MKQFFSIAKRENNSLRDFLIINKFQSKHFPSDPSETVKRFKLLGERLKSVVGDRIPVVIGFSETAVALGAYVARELKCNYITTTREELPAFVKTVGFEEVHSHAPSHKLCIREELFDGITAVIVVDDEYTTGNTAVNLIKSISSFVSEECAFYAASFVASAESERFFEENKITPFFEMYSNEIERNEFPQKFNADLAIKPREFDMTIEENSWFDFRTGTNSVYLFSEYERLCKNIEEKSKILLENAKTICVIGTEENCVLPILLGERLSRAGHSVKVHGVTRSPIMSSDSEDYPIFSRAKLTSFYDDERTVYLYNISECDLAIVLTDSENTSVAAEMQLCGALNANNTVLVRQKCKLVKTSLEKEDGIVLLKDITGKVQPMPSAEREKHIRNGVHYCELLPAEYEPSSEYLELYERGLKLWSKQTAKAVSSVAEQIYSRKGDKAVIVSLARAGTPVGALVVRYIRRKYGVNLAHYSISIIRGKGIDKSAMEYILFRHKGENIQFVDGWTGKGAINKQLREALVDFPMIDNSLAVLADPAGVCELCGTHDDIFIPCSCLNSVVSGLFSRTFLRSDLIADFDFHGAAYFEELSDNDRTYEFINAIEAEFNLNEDVQLLPEFRYGEGLEEVRRIADEYNVSDINLVKPSIGETTRVLLRRIPELILLKEKGNPLTAHIEELAAEKGVRVVEYPLEHYSAVGIISNGKADI